MMVIEIGSKLSKLTANFDKVAQFYNSNKMPESLQKAHHPKQFESDKERLEYLFRVDEEMISKEWK
ncbi:hypothetical protein [Sulfurimonas sp.]|uniref:hypothetical protein n=1 Tax=Sulfurimonas sp. TaxID=2022749 RepID=UPI00286DA0A8|nr:hypothetical protein [Sulfurimonas sp.]